MRFVPLPVCDHSQLGSFCGAFCGAIAGTFDKIKVAKGIVQPKFYKRCPKLCRVLRRSLLTTIFDEFSGISVVIKFGIFHE